MPHKLLPNKVNICAMHLQNPLSSAFKRLANPLKNNDANIPIATTKISLYKSNHTSRTRRQRKGHQMRTYLRAAYLAAKFTRNTGANWRDGLELLALMVVALSRTQSPTFNMALGQVKAKAKRMAIT